MLVPNDKKYPRGSIIAYCPVDETTTVTFVTRLHDTVYHGLFSLYRALNVEQNRRHLEIHDKRQRVDDRCDERTCHDSGVELDFFCKNGEGTADDLCRENGNDKRQRHDRRNLPLDAVKKHHFNEIDERKGDAAKERNTEFFPNHARQIRKFDFVK